MLKREKLILLFTVFILGYTPLAAQNPKNEYQNLSSAATRMAKLNFTELSDSAKSMYWLNIFHLENHQNQSNKKFEDALKVYTDSALAWAERGNCESCKTYVDLLLVNYYSDNKGAYPDPILPKNATKSLRLHFLCTSFLLDFKFQDSLDLKAIEEIKKLVFDPEIPILQRVAVSDIIATYYYYQQGDFETCKKLFEVAIKAYENKEFLDDPWHLQLENPGIYYTPIQKVSRGYLNGGLTAEKLGNYNKALKYMIKGAELYSTRRDTMGMLWAYRDLSRAFAIQQDYKNCSNYIDSTLKILKVGSFEMLKSKPQRLSEFLLNHYELIQNPHLKARIFKKISYYLKNQDSLPSSEMDVVYEAHFQLITLAELHSKGKVINLDSFDQLIALIENNTAIDLIYEYNLKKLISAQYWTLKASIAENNKDRRWAQENYKRQWSQLNIDVYRSNYYLFSKPFLRKLQDQSFLLQMNHQLSKTGAEATTAHLNYAKDRFEAWEDLGVYDSALFYHKAYSNIKDSILNRGNYIKLAQSDLDLKSLESKRISAELELESFSNKQRFLITGILAITFFFLMILFQQKRKREKVKNERNAELLQLRAQTELQKNQILEGQNKKLEKELHTSILETIHNQSRSIELGELIEELKAGSESVFVDRKAREIKRKLNEFSAEEALLDIEKSAAQLSPKLYDFLLTKLSRRNKMELMLCLMLVMNYSSDDIARLLNRSDKAIKSLRYRVRKRLDLNENQDLSEYLRLYSDIKTKASSI